MFAPICFRTLCILDMPQCKQDQVWETIACRLEFHVDVGRMTEFFRADVRPKSAERVPARSFLSCLQALLRETCQTGDWNWNAEVGTGTGSNRRLELELRASWGTWGKAEIGGANAEKLKC
jgi:hypothetical protein